MLFATLNSFLMRRINRQNNIISLFLHKFLYKPLKITNPWFSFCCVGVLGYFITHAQHVNTAHVGYWTSS